MPFDPNSPRDPLPPLNDGYPDDWFVPPSAQDDSFPDDWHVPPSAQDDSFPDDWHVPPSAQDDSFPDDWVVPGQTHDGGYRSPIAQSAPPAFSAGNSMQSAGLPDPAPSRRPLADPNSDPNALPNNWAVPDAFAQPASSSLMSPVSYQTDTKPWWIPMGPGTGFEPWAEHFIKGMQGLINYFRSRSGTGGPRGGDEEDCYTRWEREDARCEQFRPWGDRPFRACKDRASNRRNLCVRNGGQPDPAEPPEYDWRDIP
jgi:hypothetical protein